MIYRMVSVTWSRRRLLPFPIKYLFFNSLEQAEDAARHLAIILATDGFRLGESAYWRAGGGKQPGEEPPTSAYD